MIHAYIEKEGYKDGGVMLKRNRVRRGKEDGGEIMGQKNDCLSALSIEKLILN